MTTPTFASADAHNAEIAANATKFAAALLLGKGRFANAEANTLAEITEKAAQLKADHPASTREVVISAFDAAGNKAIISGAPAKPANAKKPGKAKAAKPAATRKAEKPAKPLGKRAEVEANAAAGIVPQAPDFSAETHKRFRKRLAEIEALVAAGDIKGLRALVINPVSSSPKAMLKYRDLAVIALESQRKAAKVASKAQPAAPTDVDIPAFLRQ